LVLCKESIIGVIPSQATSVKRSVCKLPAMKRLQAECSTRQLTN